MVTLKVFAAEAYIIIEASKCTSHNTHIQYIRILQLIVMFCTVINLLIQLFFHNLLNKSKKIMFCFGLFSYKKLLSMHLSSDLKVLFSTVLHSLPVSLQVNLALGSHILLVPSQSFSSLPSSQSLSPSHLQRSGMQVPSVTQWNSSPLHSIKDGSTETKVKHKLLFHRSTAQGKGTTVLTYSATRHFFLSLLQIFTFASRALGSNKR